MRIVSLVPSLTELVAHLAGSDHEIVGRTPWCIEPAHIEAVDVVGGTKTPNIGKILRLQADIVLMDAEENPKSAWEALTREGVEVMVSHIRSPSHVPEFARGLCHRLGTHHPFAERCESALEETIGSGGPRVLPLIWLDPLIGLSGDRYGGALLRHVGFDVPILEEPYPVVTPSTIADLGVEALLLSSEPHAFTLEEGDAIAATCDPTPRTIPVDGQDLTWFGWRTPDALVRMKALRSRLEDSS